jgi:hypothetical protein
MGGLLPRAGYPGESHIPFSSTHDQLSHCSTTQGILATFLLTCDCGVLRSYTAQHHKKPVQRYVLRNGCYRSLGACEKGHYGVLSITNPNYETCTLEEQQLQQKEQEGKM